MQITHFMIIRYSRIILFAVFSLYLKLSASDCDTSSLNSMRMNVFSEGIDNVEKVDLLNQIAKCYLKTDLDSAYSYAEKARDLSIN